MNNRENRVAEFADLSLEELTAENATLSKSERVKIPPCPMPEQDPEKMIPGFSVPNLYTATPIKKIVIYYLQSSH